MKKIYLFLVCNILLVMTIHAQWSLSGNSISSGNFLGTTNSQNLVFKANNSSAGYIDVSYSNTAFGLYSGGTPSSTATQNSAFGVYALQVNSTGYANVAVGYLSLPQNTSGSTNTGVGIETLYANTTGVSNTAVGALALYHNTTGSNNNGFGINALQVNTTGSSSNAFGSYALYNNTTGTCNTAMGHEALYSNTSAGYNNAFGYQTLYSNTTGVSNVAAGYQALYTNTSGGANVAIGYQSLYTNSTGLDNTAIGAGTLQSSTGSYNSALGYQALNVNTSGLDNTAIGQWALDANTTGSYNTALGNNADLYITTGSFNTAIGVSAGTNGSGYSLTNTTALGYGSTVTASNTIMCGNASVTMVGDFNGWFQTSDGRYKKNINENVPGLAFINLLRPVTYNLDVSGINNLLEAGKNRKISESEQEAINKNEKTNFTGFVAQEVEANAKKIGYDFSGVYTPQNDKDLYSLNYSSFVVPLVKAVQELSNTNDSLRSVIDSLKTAQAKLQTQVNSIVQQLNTLKATADAPALKQNAPNPFNSSTTINYYLPQNTTNAQLTITDGQGRILKDVVLGNNKGPGQAIINAGELASGIYFYSLVINGKNIDTKQMILTK